MQPISFEQYFAEKPHWPLLDVRSPGEYAKGHVPGALNLPLFNDDERAEVGTIYKQKNAQAAMLRGLQLAGAKLADYVLTASKLVPGNQVAVHCWRGGKRSGSMATLLSFMGLEVNVLEGGYKAYRQMVLGSFQASPITVIVLGGKTGSGKTEVLRKLIEAGEQVIDLEGLAHHKGSAFGALGEPPQPTTEQFENDLFDIWRHFDPAKPVWVENESKSIGRVFLPEGFWQKMGQGRLLELDVPFEQRVQRLVNEYGHFPPTELLDSLQKIGKRMGLNLVKEAAAAFAEGDLHTATGISLRYYDKTYQHATDKKPFDKKLILKTENTDPEATALELLKMANVWE